MRLLIGTCGWSYDEWEPHVYPRGLAAGERLRFIAERLPTVEIDSTYYADPPATVVEGWARTAAKAPRFEMSAKLSGAITHEAMARGTPAEVAELARKWRELVARPLADAGRLGAVLAQLSPGVLHGERSLERLDALLGALDGLAVVVELRNRSWVDGDFLKLDAHELLARHRAALALTDGPGFPDINAETGARHAYVRFHGRNSDIWFGQAAPEGDERAGRYDYRYSEDELRPWAARIATLARTHDVVRVYFNNHAEGKAYDDALALGKLMELAGAPPEKAASPQRRLF